MMARIASNRRDVRRLHFWRQYAPLLTVIAACLLNLLPVVVSSPIVPDFAYLVLVAWRLLRPEMWAATTALPLGLLNDLLAGHPIGQSMALWTVTFLVFEIMDSRLVWRDYLIDWLAASAAIIFYTFGDWYVGRLMGSSTEFIVMLPQLALSILVYPVVARIVLAIDRWRLVR
jgi:rod shape-determining protein MreD